MPKYYITYEMRDGNTSTQLSLNVEASSDRAAIQIAKGKGESKRPGWKFTLKKCVQR